MVKIPLAPFTRLMIAKAYDKIILEVISVKRKIFLGGTYYGFAKY
jgi:hypothetical protein